MLTKTVLFIHGAWMTPATFDGFCERFEDRGYECVSPAWPLMDRPVESLRSYPSPDLARLGLEDIADHYEAIIQDLEEPPILVGHAHGGLLVQLLLDRGLGVAGVAIDPASPRGARGGAGDGVVTLSREDFDRDFAPGLSQAQRDEAYRAHVVPAPGAIFGAGGRVQVRYGGDERPPLLLIAGEDNRVHSAGWSRRSFRKYRRSEAVTDFREFPERTHWILAEPGWEEVVDYSLGWLDELAEEPASLWVKTPPGTLERGT